MTVLPVTYGAYLPGESAPGRQAVSKPKGRARDTVLGALLAVALVALAIFLSVFRPLQDLDASWHQVIDRQGWLLPAAIALTVVGALLLVGAQFLPEPRRRSPPSDAALDGEAVPMAFREERERLERSFEASATVEEVMEAWRRRSWRYSRKWRILFVMMLGALLMTMGLIGVFAVLAPLWFTLLMVGALGHLGFRIGWEFWVR
jgi:predicted nucleic acid-binding Zn ribbon protein